MVERSALVGMMVKLLNAALVEESLGRGSESTLEATPTSPLVGAEAVVTSLGLVSFITDVEATLAEDHALELNLVSEQALSRRQSPFRTIDTLADYILELAGAPVAGSLAGGQA